MPENESAIPVDCWLGVEQALRETCLIEQGGNGFVIRHPDGGFRRFGFDGAGRLQPLDGTDVIGIGPEKDGLIDVVVSDDRYRLPKDLSR